MHRAPGDLPVAQLSVRPATVADAAFLEAVDASLAAESLPGIEEPLLGQLVAGQVAALRADRAARFPDAVDYVLELDGEPAGSMTVDRSEGDVLVTDITVLPAARGHGIGEFALQQLFAEGRDVTGSVLRSNPEALRLWERLGFVIEGGDEVFVSVRRAARPATG